MEEEEAEEEDTEFDEDEDGEDYDTEYRRSLKWDPVTGDFVRDKAGRLIECEGKEAFMMWCLKMVVTERDANLAYIAEVTGNDLGVDMDEALAEVDRVSVQTAIESTIKEAIEVNPRTEWVGNFSHTWEGHDVHTSFQVKGIEWDDIITIST
ncbi:MAG: DUF2634 domain-containing protein [Lachnospiraceae bacterium]|nr:DUF2634 domain-containing protein [Lachnospiraceae bacterium]